MLVALGPLQCGGVELPFLNSDSPYVQCYEEERFQSRLEDVVAIIFNIDEDDWPFILDDVVSISHRCDLLYPVANWAYCALDMDFEMCMPSSSRYVFLGWPKWRGSCFHLNSVPSSMLVAQRGVSIPVQPFILRAVTSYFRVLYVSCPRQ